MLRTRARYLVTIAAALCAWLVAAPARAAGPSCADAQSVAAVSIAIPWMYPADDAHESREGQASEGTASDASAAVSAGTTASAASPASDGENANDAADVMATVAFGASRADFERAAADLCAAAAADPNDSTGLRGAPMCDHRGSSVNAPAPFLESAQRVSGISNAAANADDACSFGQMIRDTRPGISHRDVPRADVHPSQPRCALPSGVVVSPASSMLLAPHAAVSGARSGVQMELDRPPR